MTPDEEGPTPSRWSSSLTVAVIAAVAAVAGAAVGGFATYFGNHEIQSSEAHAAAKGAARVLQGDFASVATRIEVELSRHRFIVPLDQSVITISSEDEKQIAANVGPTTWDHIAAAKLIIQDEQESAADVGNVEVLAARDHQPVVLRGAPLHFEEGSLRGVQ